MIYLIGGSSHVGKTLLAQKLMEKTGYPYTSLDHLKMGFIRTGMTNLTVEDDLEMRYFMWPFVVEIIKTAIENHQNMIIEGCYIPAEWKDSFDSDYLAHIKSQFVVMSEEYIRNHFSDIVGFANVIEQRVEDNPDMERLIDCSAGFIEDCIEYNVPYYVIDKEFSIENMLEQLYLK